MSMAVHSPQVGYKNTEQYKKAMDTIKTTDRLCRELQKHDVGKDQVDTTESSKINRSKSPAPPPPSPPSERLQSELRQDFNPLDGKVVVEDFKGEAGQVKRAEYDYAFDQPSGEPLHLEAEILKPSDQYPFSSKTRKLTLDTIDGQKVYQDSWQPGVKYIPQADGNLFIDTADANKADTLASIAGPKSAKQTRKKPSWNLLPRELPVDAPERIKFGSRLVLKKLTQSPSPGVTRQAPDMIVYKVYIKGKPTYIFIMDKLDPATALDWSGTFPDRKGVILADRDGVVKDSRFLNDTDKQNAEDVMVDSALEASKRLNEAGIGLGIVTNQGGYQWDRMSFEDMVAINVRVIQQIANAGGHVDAVFVCPFAKPLEEPKPGVYDARKPEPGMFMYAEQLAAKGDIPVLASTGDQRSDGAAAQAAGQKFYAITGPTGRWQTEEAKAQERGKELPKLMGDSSVYEEITEFADVVDAVLKQVAAQD